ncbi:MAG: metallophosphoesterase family protein [Balneolales bacterium]
MKLGIISDIHANLPALKVCLKKLDELNVEKIICLGDMVGYGPYPNECCDIIRDRNIPTVLGNHDGAITGAVPLRTFREPNHSLLKWTHKIITPENKAFLNSLNLTLTDGENWLATHSSPIDPTRWVYLDSATACREVLKKVEQDIIFVGHTHKPAVIAEKFGVLSVKPGQRYVINPGSIGQSRDSDHRASFSVMDTNEFKYENFRLDYSVQETLDHYMTIGFSEKQGKIMLGI